MKEVVSKVEKVMIPKLQKKQIMNVAKTAKMLNSLKDENNKVFKNSITANNIDIDNIRVIKKNWDAGRRDIYSRQTLAKMEKTRRVPLYTLTRQDMRDIIARDPNRAPRYRQLLENNPDAPEIVFFRETPTGLYTSPFTRNQFTPDSKGISSLRKVINRDYRGKYNLVKKMMSDPNVAVKEIADLYA